MMSNVEEEVDTIRDALYEKTKDMTAAQRSEYFHALSEQAGRDYGIWKPGHKTEDSAVTHMVSETNFPIDEGKGAPCDPFKLTL
jgi:hypothetical protein